MQRSAGPLAMIAFVASSVFGCGAEIAGGGGGDRNNADANTADAPQTLTDAATPDAPVDARPCTGGVARMTSSDGSCFVLFDTPRTFADAMAACSAISAQLAIVNTADRYAVAKSLAGTRDAWIGLSDQAVEMQFRWIDNATPLVFTAWDPNEPNNSAGGGYEEDCAIIAGARMGDWDDRPCTTGLGGAGSGAYAYLCHY